MSRNILITVCDAVGAHRRAPVAAEPFLCGSILVERRRPRVDVATRVDDRHDAALRWLRRSLRPTVPTGTRVPPSRGPSRRTGRAPACVRDTSPRTAIDIGAPSEMPMSTARSEPTASITARTSSIRSSSGTGATLRSERPEAALVEADETAERRQPAEEAGDRRVLPLDVEMTRETLTPTPGRCRPRRRPGTRCARPRSPRTEPEVVSRSRLRRIPTGCSGPPERSRALHLLSAGELGHHVAGERLDLGSTGFRPTADEVAVAGVAPLRRVLAGGVEIVERE